MTPAADVWITAAVRTAVTGRSRVQAHRDAGELGADVVAAVTRGRAEEGVAGVVLGNCWGPGGNPARVAALGAGLGDAVPGWTVDAQCGSGLLAVLQAAGHAALTGRPVVGGGVESASTAPERLRDGVPYTQAPMVPRGRPDPGMTAAADALAAARGITRARQEAFAARSHALALAAAELRAAERARGQEGASAPDDDGPRRLTPAALARFTGVTPGADPDTAVTGGTAARIADGAAAVLLEPGVPDTAPLARPVRLAGGTVTGGDPALPGIAPVAAVRAALDEVGWALEDLAVVEVVEAYAAQALATLDDLGLTDGDAGVDPRVNAAGGALALGHPWGASAAVALVRAVHRLQEQPPGARGLVACAVAGGMGVAALLEVR
ncbi:acetyl-CoA C-acyltransferase [Micrococcus flavus]|uniref:Probable acetyl-CoA acetyltransferase n=1 Tax=Micrococcus flavus TaxID=384602 RepID=A0A4Y8X249_9MICC|nr:acetyl-CoA C-acyltransferase [Micrococcus flavus]MBB4881811.1 acetyl-CoA C-acetyltransferase [Micrococcus flavus]TFI03636.1 acetyl-CoA C-acyltransferase [Micrococcus flavus]GGK45046.1 acetyl-CoA acetyltransferase [Micrococcus flavus]